MLGAPFAVLVLATLSAWPWRALQLPGMIGTLTPPSIFFMAIVVAGAMYALQRRLPLGMVTWVPAGQGAIVLLTTSFVADTTEPFVGIAIIIAYVLIYLIVLGIAMVVAGTSTPLAIAFVAFFVLTQATRFPLYGVDAPSPISASMLLTIVVSFVSFSEVVLLAWLARRLIEAPDADARKICRRQFAGDIATHLDAIAQKYIITGETSENALMFVPSESIYSEIHSHHEALVQKSYRSRVYIVSPSTLWATMNTMRAIFRDVHMREQADIIQNEVVRMLEDVGRLDHRINSLERTYSQMGEEFRKVRISTDKIIKRGAGIESLEFDQSASTIDDPTNT